MLSARSWLMAALSTTVWNSFRGIGTLPPDASGVQDALLNTAGENVFIKDAQQTEGGPEFALLKHCLESEGMSCMLPAVRRVPSREMGLQDDGVNLGAGQGCGIARLAQLAVGGLATVPVPVPLPGLVIFKGAVPEVGDGTFSARCREGEFVRARALVIIGAEKSQSGAERRDGWCGRLPAVRRAQDPCWVCWEQGGERQAQGQKRTARYAVPLVHVTRPPRERRRGYTDGHPAVKLFHILSADAARGGVVADRHRGSVVPWMRCCLPLPFWNR